MKNTLLGILIAVAVFLVIGTVSSRYDMPQASLGGMTNYDGLTLTPVESTDGFKLGRNGTSPGTFTYINGGTFTHTSCTGGSSIAGTSTALFDCAVTNSAAGDLVFVSAATSTAYGVYIAGAQASSTANFITIRMGNASSTAVATTTGMTYILFRKL